MNSNTNWLKLSILLQLVCWVGGPRWASAQSSAIQSRLVKARSLQSAANAPLSPLERDLLFFANFENDGALLGNSEAVRFELEKDHYRPGKFGRGYYFEKARHNLLPPEMADVESGIQRFKGCNGGQLKLLSADTQFGKKALSVAMPGADAGLETVPVKIVFRLHLGHEKAVTLLASCFVKGSKDAKLKMALSLTRQEPPKENPVQDESSPQEIALTGEWQRVACSVKSDSRLTEREAVLSLTSVNPTPITLLADGFQFEQAGYYPHNHLMPTSWTPGGKSLPATFIDINQSDLVESFPAHEGTISLWTSTPHLSNLANPGGICWLSFGVWWHDPQWAMGTYIFQTGEKFCYSRLPANITDGDWHHVALSWDRTKGYEYQDGKLLQTFDRVDNDISKRLELYQLRLGGSRNDGQAANSIMDEVAIFKRKLSDAEVQQLATATAPLRPTANKLLFSRVPRAVFYRNEAKSSLDVELQSLAPVSGSFNADISIGDAIFVTQPISLKQGSAVVHFEFSPSQLKCGVYPCRVGAIAADGSAAYYEFPIEVVPALRMDNYTIASWAHGGETPEWRDFCRTVGVNTIDTGDLNLDALGKNGFLYSWHYNFFESGGVWSPENRTQIREQTQRFAQQRMGFPNWRFTLLNSETAPWIWPDEKDRKAWFDVWAQKELGYPVPEKGWKFGTTTNPIQCWFPDARKPGKDGVYEPTNEFKFLKWWYNRGCGWWRVDAEAASEIKKARPDVINFTEPLGYPGQIADLDAGSNWSYQVQPEPLIGEFETAQACARGSGKEFYVTLGMNYVSGDWLTVTEPDGVKKNLMPTADDMIQQTWIAIAYLPTDAMAYWYLDGWYNGLRKLQNEYCPPESDVKLGMEIRQNLQPLGTMLKGAPNAQRSVALLLPESTLWFDAGEGGWGWGTAHYPNHWKDWVGKMGVPYDLVLDHNVTPSSLSKYKVVIFPMAEYVSSELYKELVAAANAGTKIIVDSYCKQEYPNMERWPQEYFYRMADDKRKDYGKETEQRLTGLREKLLPEMDAYAVGAEGKVLLNVREFNGVKYVCVINNNRQPGPYTEWTKKEEFQPYGKEQTAKVYLRVSKGSVVYEFTESRKLPTTFENDHVVVSLKLPPHAGRLLCVYSRELKAITVAPPATCKRGQATSLDVTLTDSGNQPAKGRQLFDVKITDPSGKEHDESGLYRAADGKARVPFRPALNDAAGKWNVEVRERTSGLTTNTSVAVKP